VMAADPVSAFVSDAAAEVRAVERNLRRAVTVSRSSALVELMGAVRALAALLRSAVADGDLGTGREVSAQLVSTVDRAIEQVDRGVFCPADERKGQNLFPSSPEIEAVLALERALRSTLEQQDDFAREVVKDAMLSLASAARYRHYSFALETCIARAKIVANDYLTSPQVITPVGLLAQLGHLAYAADRRHAKILVRKALKDLCGELSGDAQRGTEAGYCLESYAEVLAFATRFDYSASDRVLEGAGHLSNVYRTGASQVSRAAARVALLELGGAAFEAARYSLAFGIARVIVAAGINPEGARRVVGDPELSARLQFRTGLAGGVFGSDVEATVRRYVDWIENLPGELTGLEP
jgi:hypothetical protein